MLTQCQATVSSQIEVCVELGFRDMWLSSATSPATFSPFSLAIRLLLPSLSPLSLPLLLPQAAGQKEVCSCFVIRSLKEKWDENRTGCVLGRLFALGRFHMRALVM